jgi:hypothetical protein
MAKSKGIGRGGKRKGAGRPRFMKTGKASYISIRITQETRDLVEVEARKSRKSLSAIAEDLLRMGLEIKTDRREEKSERALVFLIKHLMLAIGTGAGGLNWRVNPYTFEAFRAALLHLLDALKPAGEVIKPSLPEGRAPLFPLPDAPQDYGRNITSWLLLTMQSHRYSAGMGAKPPESGIRGELLSTHYGLVNAQKDLGLEDDLPGTEERK